MIRPCFSLTHKNTYNLAEFENFLGFFSFCGKLSLDVLIKNDSHKISLGASGEAERGTPIAHFARSFSRSRAQWLLEIWLLRNSSKMGTSSIPYGHILYRPQSFVYCSSSIVHCLSSIVQNHLLGFSTCQKYCINLNCLS